MAYAIRDILCNEVPFIFRKEIYATAALIGAGVYISLVSNFSFHFAELISVALVIGIRLTSVYLNWHVPKI